MINIQKILKTLEKEYDDIIWDFGSDDPRLTKLANDIVHYKKLDARGEHYEPDF